MVVTEAYTLHDNIPELLRKIDQNLSELNPIVQEMRKCLDGKKITLNNQILVTEKKVANCIAGLNKTT